MAWTVEFYTDPKGRSPVEEFLNSLPSRDRDHVVQFLLLLQERGVRLRAPYVRHLQGKLWELRVRTRGSAYRIIYFAHTGQRFILLHGFVKKTRRTPRQALETAEQRRTDFLDREDQG